jgi:hypothetical protein
VRSAVAASLALVACTSGPGTLVSPLGTEPLRTALYRVGIVDGAPEIVVLLSNGDLECGLPAFRETERQAEASEGLLAAACREGAQHLVLFLYTLQPTFTGRYEGVNRASVDELGEDDLRVARGAYYGIEEAVLVLIDGLERGYEATDDLYLPVLGDGGEVDITAEDTDRLEGTLQFPGQGLFGEFRAERCTGSTQLIDTIAAAPLRYCQ